MDVSRRTFLKTTVIGGAGLSAFGFSLAPVYAQTQGLKIARTTRCQKLAIVWPRRKPSARGPVRGGSISRQGNFGQDRTNGCRAGQGAS